MLGVGWTELLLVGVVALIVIGPKDLPDVMRKMGKVVGTIRRMGGEFQRELNKTTGIDQITDIRRSITEPLRQTGAEIAKEFNSIGKDGAVVPSGALKPTDPQVESVVDAINKQAGLAVPAPQANAAASAAIAKAVTESVKAETAKAASAAPAATPAPPAEPAPAADPAVVKPAARKRVPKAKPAPTVPVTSADLPPIAAPEPKPAARKARVGTETSPAPVEAVAPAAEAAAPTRSRRSAAKPAADKAVALDEKAAVAPAKPRARKS